MLYLIVRCDGGSFKQLRQFFAGNLCRSVEHSAGDNRVRGCGVVFIEGGNI